MVLRRCRLGRALRVWLVLLALSPLTAPFSTVDVGDMLGEKHGGGAILQSKNAKNDTAAVLVVSRGLAEPPIISATLASGPMAPVRARAVHAIPLRI